MLVYFSLIMEKIEEASQCQDCIPKESMNFKKGNIWNQNISFDQKVSFDSFIYYKINGVTTNTFLIFTCVNSV